MANIFKNSQTKISVLDSTSRENRGAFISIDDMYPGVARKLVNDSMMLDSNFSFFSSALAKVHTELAEPKYFVTYLQDIPVEYGGGFVDYVTFQTVNWSGLIDELRAVGTNASTFLPKVNAGLTQERVNVYTFEVGYDISFLELEKAKKLELKKSIEEVYQNAVVAGFDLFVQKIAYLGIDGNGGLFNSSSVLANTIDNTGAQVDQGTKGLDDKKVVAIFNKIFETYLEGTNNNLALLPDVLLVPTFVASDLSSRHNTLYTSTLRKFLAEHNLAVDEGELPKIEIHGRADLNKLGSVSKGRIVAYKKDQAFVRLDIPYPVQHFNTLPDINKKAYTTMFVGQVSEIQMPYNVKNEFGVVSYWDFTN